jgi:hypothetical protein
MIAEARGDRIRLSLTVLQDVPDSSCGRWGEERYTVVSTKLVNGSPFNGISVVSAGIR